ncbi:Uncharacterized membrane protein [Devosia sp. YR412]|uniref:DUF1345 domain-containing protein n=1 Tax=Devosia sp. YR412 TaxID=1881030 RepID=UPI0008D0DE58|nr:DUF1345 domain-containing protein [Devosia sp. YR412]SEQ43928.1 Uncharacterized membrane protein [Devosia sp. YR412]
MATRRKQPVKKVTKPAEAHKPSGRHRLGHKFAALNLPRHGALFIGLGVGAVVFVITMFLLPTFAIPFGAIGMFVTYLGLMFVTLPVLTADFLKSRADATDSPTPLIFVVVLGVVGTSCATLFMALNGEDGPLLYEVIISVTSVLLGWFVVHTLAAMHYAYEYYESPSANPNGQEGKLIGGLEFPDGDNPDGVAFLYFAYVVGVAFAVSDIRVTSNKMRKMVVLHSTFSYFFNTLIVAATVNVAVAVGGV